VVPSKGTADAIKNVDSGVAQIGFIDVPSLVAAGGAAAAVKMVAVNYQKPPYCVFSLNPGANVTSPKDMVGLEFGSSTASFMPRIAMAFMKMHGLDSSTLRVVNIDGAARVPMLAARKVQSIDQFVMSEPGIRRAVKDAEVKCMLFGDHGLDIYSNGIGVREDFLKQNPDVVRGFVRAALRGWKDAMSNPEEAAKIQVQFVKALDPGLIVDELRIVRRLAVTPDTEKEGLGAMNRAKMARSVEFMNTNVEISGRKLTVDDIFRPGYLPNPPIRP
jgi:NitT/TauT family transport system substrate-binding protein